VLHQGSGRSGCLSPTIACRPKQRRDQPRRWLPLARGSRRRVAAPSPPAACGPEDVAQARRARRSRQRRREAKTEFFSNVSHEFRTAPMLAPLDETLRDAPPERRQDVELVTRNARRLLRLVGTLLDFSQIEAGRLPRQVRADRSDRAHSEHRSANRERGASSPAHAANRRRADRRAGLSIARCGRRSP